MEEQLPPATVDALSPPPGARFPYRFFRGAADRPFRPAHTVFDLRNAAWLCDAAFLAYSRGADIDAAYASLPHPGHVRHFAGRHGTACHVATSDEWIVLAFRGTEVNNFWTAALDIATDAHLIPMLDEHHDFVHAGFLQGVSEVWQEVRAHIAAEQRSRPRPLWITWHSLVAGLAAVAASRCSADPALGAAGLYVYASPPVGDRRFAARITMPAFRIANNTDWLTHVPFGAFAPVGSLMFIDGNGHLHQQMPPAVELLIGLTHKIGGAVAPAVSRLLSTLAGDIILPSAIADHAPVNYAIRLRNADARA